MTESENAESHESSTLNKRQVEALERVASHIAPDEVVEERRWRRLITRGVAFSVAGVSIVLAVNGIAVWAYDTWQTRQTINTWLTVAREVYEDEGNGEVAQAFLDRVAEIAPQNAELIRLQAYIEGMDATELLLQLDRPWNREELNQADMAKANAILLNELSPNSPDGSILRGQVTAALGEHERAVSFLEQALAIDPDSAFARVRLAMVHFTMAGMADQEAEIQSHVATADQLLEKARSLDPDSRWAAVWQAYLDWELRDDWDSASRWLDRAIEIDPRFYLAHLSKGQMHLDVYEFAEAEEAFNRTLKLRPEMPLALVGLAFVHGYQDQYESGLQFAERANAADGGFLEGWQVTGLINSELLIRDGDRQAGQRAVDAFSHAIRLDPSNSQWYWQRSELHTHLGNLLKAGQDGRLATRFGPDDAYAWMHLGHFQAALEPPLVEQAKESFAKAVNLDPALDDARRGLAEMHAASGELHEASLEFDYLVEHSTEDLRGENLCSRAKFHEDQGHVDEAYADYQAARDDTPELFEAWLGEARTAIVLGNADAAREAIDMCRQLKPGDARIGKLDSTPSE